MNQDPENTSPCAGWQTAFVRVDQPGKGATRVATLLNYAPVYGNTGFGQESIPAPILNPFITEWLRRQMSKIGPLPENKETKQRRDPGPFPM